MKIAAILILGAGLFAFAGCAMNPQATPHVGLKGEAAPAISDADYEGTAATRATNAMLEEKGSLVVTQKPLKEALQAIAQGSGVVIVPNWKALEAASITADTLVTLDIHDRPWKRTLLAAMSDAGGGAADVGFFVEDDGSVTVSTQDDLQSTKYQLDHIFNIGFILDAIDPSEPPVAVMGAAMSAEGLFPPPSPFDPRVKMLMDAICATVAPESWKGDGGVMGSMRAIDGVLVVHQTRPNLRAIAALLANLRASAETRLRIYDVSDLVGNDDKKLHALMDLMEGLSASRMWVEKGGRMAKMRGMGGRIYVEGAAHVQEEVAMQLRVIREGHPEGRGMNLVIPSAPPVVSP